MLLVLVFGVLAFRIMVAVVTREIAFRWTILPAAWVAVFFATLGSSGCADVVQPDDPPVVFGGGVIAVDDEPDVVEAPQLIHASLFVGDDAPDAYVAVGFYVTCPVGAPDGPHAGQIDHLDASGAFHTVNVNWTCGFSQNSISVFNIPCGIEVRGRVTIVHPITGELVTEATPPHTTCTP